MITNTQKVRRDISQAPYYDMEYTQIVPGQMVVIWDGEPILGTITIEGESLCFNATPLDDIFEVTDSLQVVGWVQ